MVTVARRPWLTVAALVLVLASGTVYAHRGATGIVKKRPPFDGSGRQASFDRSKSLTRRGLALPLVDFITWPTKNPRRLVLPSR